MNATCYSRDELRNFTLGRLQETLARSIESHIDVCPACEETVAILDDATDSLLRELRTGARQELDAPSANEPALQMAMAELEQVNVAQLASEQFPDHQHSGDTPLKLRDYELIEPLGFGGMGTVYRARHARLERMVALKLLPARRMQDPSAVTRFQREMRAIGQLDHSSIVRATDAGEVDGHHFLAMELVDGADLGRIVRRTGPIDVANACELIRLAAIGMQYAHDRLIIHRDLKPSNLMLTGDGKLKILDLGLALLASQNGTVDELTTVGQLMGTLDYMAPEQFGDCHAVDHRVDVYSLAATLYKLLSGRAPYSGDDFRTPLQKLKGIATSDPLPIRDLLPSLDLGLASLIHHALHRNPNERIAAASVLAEQLKKYTQEANLQALWHARQASLQEDIGRIQINEVSPQAPFIELQSRGANSPVPRPSRPIDRVSPPSSNDNNWRRFLMAALGMAGCLFFGLAIYIATNRGTLTVESPRDDLQLQVVRSGKIYKQLTVNKGKASWSLALGEYEVKLTHPADSLTIQNGEFTLRRGEEQIATISAKQHTAASPAAATTQAPGIAISTAPPAAAGEQSSGPRYENYTFAQWRDIFLNERSPNRRGTAVQAMLALADGNNLREAIDTIYENSSYRERTFGFKDETRNEVNTIYQLIHDFVHDETHRKVYALKRWLAEDSRQADGYKALLKIGRPNDAKDREIVRQIINAGLAHQNDLESVSAAICALHHAAWMSDVPDRIRRTLQASTSRNRQAQLAFLLVLLGQEQPAEIQLLTELATNPRSDSWSRDTGLAGLLWLGPRAKSAAEPLIATLKDPKIELRQDFGLLQRHWQRSHQEPHLSNLLQQTAQPSSFHTAATRRQLGTSSRNTPRSSGDGNRLHWLRKPRRNEDTLGGTDFAA